MSSISSKFATFIMRIFSKLAFRPGANVADYNKKLAHIDKFKKGKMTVGITMETAQHPMPSRWLHNSVNDSGKIILYLHGGAFILNLPETYSAMVSRLCHGLGASAYLPWYRLAPEHHFPAAPDDCLIAYEYLLQQYKAEDIYIMGDSAGANLSLCLLNYIKQKRLPMPRAAMVLSPITDFLQISSTWLLHKWKEPLFKVQDSVAPQQHYLQGENLMNPLASPIYGDLKGLPPLLLVVGGVEALREDSVAYVRKAVESNVNAQVHIWQGMPHVHTLMEFLPESSLAEEQIFLWAKNLPPLNEPLTIEQIWRKAVTLFNRNVFTSRLDQITNGDQVYNPALLRNRS